MKVLCNIFFVYELLININFKNINLKTHGKNENQIWSKEQKLSLLDAQ